MNEEMQSRSSGGAIGEGKPASPDTDRVNVLIVDDRPKNQLVYQTILEDLGHNLVMASSGEEALKMLLNQEFAVILLDVHMPGMDGFETAALIRQRKRSAHTPIIFLTAFSDEINLATAYAQGAVDYLLTPVVPDILRAKVRVFIELFQMRSKAAEHAEERAKRAAAEESDRRKDEFLAMLAHELRNPLAPLSNALQILQLPGVDEAWRKEALSVMNHQISQMVRLVDDLLDVSRISHGKVELRKDRIMLSQVVQQAMETARPLIDEYKHVLSVQLPPTTVWLDADLMRLSQVFSNLLNNAAKYTRTGGRIWLEAGVNGNQVEVRVRDTGIGIAADMLPRIFDIFTQVDNSIERAQGGLGIGLTLVKSLVEMHSGTIEARSDGVGKGSEFIVRLPLALALSHDARAPEAALGSEPVNDHDKTSRLRILVTDDSKMSAKTLGYMLEMLGHEVRCTFDGASTLAAAQSFKPDVIFLDIGLPGMNGYEVCKQLRAEPTLKEAVLVAQTGWSQEEHRRRSHEAGFDHHLVKPVDFPMVEKLLGSIHLRSPAA